MHSPSLEWRRPFRQLPQTGVAAVVLLGLCFAFMRALAVLGPQPLRPLLPLSFALMAATPWLFLRHEGRRQIGIVHANSKISYVWAAVAGALLAVTCGAIGSLLFSTTQDNWFVSIARSFQQSFDTTGKSTLFLFVVFTTPALIFSPLGEEIFFRGMLQRSLEESLPRNASTYIECAAFATVHLCHHGLHWTDNKLSILLPSGLLWMALMFLAAQLFAYWRRVTISIFPSIVSHVAFNAAMSIYIFSFVWDKVG
jgi:membrane protease YdiL (CAAX protease family)